MADSVTPNLGLVKPEVGASYDTWGTKVNGNADILDAKILSRDGGAMAGPITDMGAASTVKDAGGTARPIGFRNIPGRTAPAATMIGVADAGGKIKAAGAITVPANATVAFPVDDGVLVVNITPNSIAITPAAGVTLRLAGSATVGARTLAGFGRAFLSKEYPDEWHASGAGLS